MLDQFSATIEKIYAAAADASLWGDALCAIEDCTGSTGAVLNLVPRTDDAPPLCLAGSFSRANCEEYARDYMWRCPRIAWAQDHRDIPVHYDSMILSEYEMDRDATYAWYGSHGLRYYVAGWIGRSSGHEAYMSLQRSRRQGHVEQDDVDRFALLLRHMTQALAMAVRLGTLDEGHKIGSGLLDRLQNASFILNYDGTIFLSNASADRLVAKPDGLAVCDRRLRCDLSSEQSVLDQLISGAAALKIHERRGGGLRITRRSGRPPFVALISYLADAPALFGVPSPKVLVIINDPVDVSAIGTELLRDIYGLTDTEARLATAIGAGHSAESAATSLDMQIATARFHLKSIFAKLGVNRQQDMVRLLTKLSSVALSP